MRLKINRALIPLLFLSALLSVHHGLSSNQPLPIKSYVPIISEDNSGWIGPYGGYIVSLVYDPSNPEVAYAGSFGSGMYKSLDGGMNWSPINQGLTNLYINSLAVDPKQSSTLYAGTYKSGVFKSVDSGSTWSWSSSGMQDQAIVYSLAVDPIWTNIIYAATRGKSNNCNEPWNGVIYKSEDAGATWSPALMNVGTTQDWAYSLMVEASHHDHIYAALHENGPYKSNNEGSSWYPIADGISDLSGRSIVITPDFSTIFYGVWHNDSLYQSVNFGSSWYRPDVDIPWSKVYSISIDPQEADTIYLATFNRGILKSINGGLSWPYGYLIDNEIYSISINPADSSSLLAGSSGNGLFGSGDAGSSWSPQNSGIENSMVTSIVPSPTDATIYASIYGAGVYQSADHGKSWSSLNTGLADKFVHDLVMNPAQPGLLFAATESGGLFRNDVNTTTGWIKVSSGLPFSASFEPAYSPDHPFATLNMQEEETQPEWNVPEGVLASDKQLSMIYAPSDAQIAYLGTGQSGVYKSTNGGLGWLPAGLGGQSINSLAVDESNHDLVYAVSSTPGACYYYGSLKVSDDGGISWTPYGPLTNYYSLAASPTEPGVLYAGTMIGIYRLHGTDWSFVGLYGEAITTITLDPSQPEAIYAGTTNGAYYSQDGGATWEIVDDKLDGLVIESIEINPFAHNVAYIATKTHGIYNKLIR